MIRTLRKAVLVLLIMLAAAGLLVLLMGPVSSWAMPTQHLQGKDEADVRNATRQILLAAVGGMVLLIGAAFTARTFFLTRRGQFTDRYAKAIGLLASDKLTERLGGIYALQHLMIESERDHHTVVEVLAAFVRERTREDTPQETDPSAVLKHEPEKKPVPSTDVQAALTVLGRRPNRFEPYAVDLRGADLRGAALPGARLANADFENANLQFANLRSANLRAANFRGAQLEDAILSEATLNYAFFANTRLKGAGLYKAKLQWVIFDQVHGLSADQLESAITDKHTHVYPPGTLHSETSSASP